MDTNQEAISHNNTGQRTIIFIVLCIALVAALCACTPVGQSVTSKADTQNNHSVVITASHADGSAVSEEEMTAAVTILTNRMNSFGESGATVQREGNNQILIQAPFAISQMARSTLLAPGKLEFVDLRDVTDAVAVADIESGQVGMTLEQGTYTAFMTGDTVTRVDVEQASPTSAYSAIKLELDSTGKAVFANVTSELAPINGRVAILVDGVVKCAPSVYSAISDGQVEISGRYNYEDAKALKTTLDSNLLPEGLILSISSSAD